METRIILAGIVVLGCALCGKALCEAARQRAALLRNLIEDVRVLRIHMLSMYEPVRDSLARLNTPLMRGVAEGMHPGISAREAWQELWNAGKFRPGPAAFLYAEDRQVLDELFEKLGQSGREKQDALLTATVEQLEAQLATAGEKAKTAERLYGTMGLLVGLLLAIIVV